MRKALGKGAGLATLVVLTAAHLAQAAGSTERAGVGMGGVQADGGSYQAAVSGTGRYVAFTSDAANLVADDANGQIHDCFVRDRQKATTELISKTIGPRGTRQNCDDVRISRGGQFVAFGSIANNLVTGDANRTYDVFLRDRGHGTTTLVSQGADGLVSQGADGAFGNGPSFLAALSPNARFVAFTSYAANLVATPLAGNQAQLYVRDMKIGRTVLASVSNSGQPADRLVFRAIINLDGRYTAFVTAATNLSSPDRGGDDVFRHDRDTGKTILVSAGLDGAKSNGYSDFPAIADDGQHIAFSSRATNLTAGGTNGKLNAFLWDGVAGTTRRLSVGLGGQEPDGDTKVVGISDHGRYVALISSATNLAPGDTNSAPDVFVLDTVTLAIERVDVSSAGAQADGPVDDYEAAISADGKVVGFISSATNLVPGDTNQSPDVFAHTR